MKNIPVIIDTDPGIDDAAAIVIALKSQRLDVKLLTTVTGNVNVDKTTVNALKLVEFIGVNVPVAKGMRAPILREPHDAAGIHGESGMEGYDFPAPGQTYLKVHAVEALRDTLVKSNKKITLIPVAALTNIAVLFTMYPEVKEKVERIVMMGGCLGKGNTNTASEFNIFVDPHAAKIVFNSGVDITLIPLDITRQAKIHKESSEKIRASGKTGAMLYALFQKYRGGSLETGLIIHDACAIACLLKPELFKTRDMYLDVVTEGPAAGALVADAFIKLYKDKTPNAHVCTEVDAVGFEKLFVDEITK